MTAQIIISILIMVIVVLISLLLSGQMKKIYNSEKNLMDFAYPLEQWIFKICRINPSAGMDWKKYLQSLLFIQLIWFCFGFVILLFQGVLFLNPAKIPNMEWSLAINSTISFLTSTNLQHYAGETGASYLSQTAVFMFLQFVSAGTSLAAGVAIVRGLAKNSGKSLGNFYSDFVKSCTRILLPLSIITAVFFIFNGMPMTFDGPQKMISLQGDTSIVATGPAAAMIPIKELGSNGGGFFGANCAHPFENPNFLTFIVHLLIVWLLPMAFVFFIGKYLDKRKFSLMLFGVMLAGFLLILFPIIKNEVAGNPAIEHMGINTLSGNMEGKEVRFGTFYSAFYSTVNMVVPAGTVTGMHDSYMPISAIGMLIGMQVDAFFGALGTGWINMFIYLIIATFIASLMIGRTAELLGRKVSIKEMQAAVLVNLISFSIPLILTAIACFTYMNDPDTSDWLPNKGPHGFTTMLYEYISSMAGNGSGFEGLGDNTHFWNLSTSIAMLAGRYIPIIGAFFIVGSMRKKIYTPPSLGSLKVESATFAVFLFVVIMILTVLSMFVVFCLGPINEFYQLSNL